MVEGVFSRRYKIERLKRKKSIIKDSFKLYVKISYTVTKGNLSTIIIISWIFKHGLVYNKSNESTRVLSRTDIQKRRKIRKIVEELSTLVHKYQF